MWPSIQSAYVWVERVAHVLANTLGERGNRMRQRLVGVVAALCVHLRRTRSPLRSALAHLLLETRRYWPGLVYTYDVEGLPRTNNDLEHLFGCARYHQRRASGCRRGSEGLVARGQVRIIAATATRLSPVQGADLAPKSQAAWRQLRTTLNERRHSRVLGRRFRRDPATYLLALEERLRSALPP